MDNDKMCCKNCRYFNQFYIWSANALNTVNCGNCKLSADVRKIIKNIYTQTCEKWEPNAIRKKEQKEVFKKMLTDMSERIKQLVIYFEEDL